MPKEVHVVGLDIAKSVFQVHGADRSGKAVVRRRLRRDDVENFFRDLAPCLVGIEACPSAHHWARRLRDLGHEVRLIPAQYVRPFVKTNKNDAADAEAISEAVVRPSMRFVPIKEEMQQEILMIHRVREMLVGQRTQLINAIRGHLAEFGVIAPNRAHNIGLLTAMIEDVTDLRIPPVARHALRHLVEQLREVKTKLVRIEEDLAMVAKRSDEAMLAPLRRAEWVVYAKRPFAGPAAVLAYLSRYTHRVAISNSRLLAMDDRGVTFRWKDYRARAKATGDSWIKAMTLPADEFIRRFLLHVLPDGFHRTRHYGLFAGAIRAANIDRIRALLAKDDPGASLVSRDGLVSMRTAIVLISMDLTL
ncbi:IS110 family transposase [Xanthobacter sp. KR7-65]|uniref:IS110 family transposase n=1 Tax=Xanthobacter TaxID=279 RepID=UPI0032B5BFBC